MTKEVLMNIFEKHYKDKEALRHMAVITPAPGCPDPSPTQLLFLRRYEKLSNEITLRESQLLRLLDLLAGEDLLRTILEKRYIKHQTWLDIALDISYSETQLYRLRIKAFEVLCQKCNDALQELPHNKKLLRPV